MVAPPSRLVDVAEWKRTHRYREILIDSTETIDITFDYSGELTTGDQFGDAGVTFTPYTQVASTIWDTATKTVSCYLRGPAIADGTETVIVCAANIEAYSTTLTSVGACILRQRNH